MVFYTSTIHGCSQKSISGVDGKIPSTYSCEGGEENVEQAIGGKSEGK